MGQLIEIALLTEPIRADKLIYRNPWEGGDLPSYLIGLIDLMLMLLGPVIKMVGLIDLRPILFGPIN